MSLTVDRFEGAFALCQTEEREMLRLPRAALPASCREGDRVRRTPEGWVVEPDDGTRAEIERRMHDLFR